MLDLEVLAGDVDHLAAFREAHQVACAVDRLQAGGIERVLREGGGGALRVLVVAHGDGGAAHAQLADLPRRGGRVVLAQQQDALVGEGDADGQRLADLERAVHDVIGAVAGDLCRTVEVDVQDVRQVLLQLVQVLDGHDLAGEEDGAQRVRFAVVERVHRRDEAQRAHRPDEHGRAAVAQKIHQLGRLGEVRGGDDLHGGACEQAAVDVLDADVEVERGLVGEHVAVGDGEDLREAGDEIDHAAVADDHALGRAGRAGGEVDVQRIDVDHAATDGGESGVVDLMREQILHAQERAPGLHRLELRKVRAVGDDDRGIERAQNAQDAGGGVAQVQGRIGAARVHRAHEAHERGDGLVHVKAEHRARLHMGQQRGGDGARAVLELRKRHGGVRVGEGRLGRQARGGFLQVIQNQRLHRQVPFRRLAVVQRIVRGIRRIYRS